MEDNITIPDIESPRKATWPITLVSILFGWALAAVGLFLTLLVFDINFNTTGESIFTDLTYSVPIFLWCFGPLEIVIGTGVGLAGGAVYKRWLSKHSAERPDTLREMRRRHIWIAVTWGMWLGGLIYGIGHIIGSVGAVLSFRDGDPLGEILLTMTLSGLIIGGPVALVAASIAGSMIYAVLVIIYPSKTATEQRDSSSDG